MYNTHLPLWEIGTAGGNQTGSFTYIYIVIVHVINRGLVSLLMTWTRSHVELARLPWEVDEKLVILQCKLYHIEVRK